MVIDGGPMNGARKVFDKVGVTDYKQVRVTGLGIEKVKGVRCTPEQIGRMVARTRDVIAKS